MKLPLSNFFERRSAVENALRGVPVSDERLKVPLFMTLYDRDSSIDTPAYLLYLDNINHYPSGLFIVDGNFVEVPIGFQRTSYLFSRRYYDLNENGLKEHSFDNNLLYLPLRLTNIGTNVGETVARKFIPYPGSPFPVFGIEGSQGTLPLVLILETEDGIERFCLYKTLDNGILSCVYQTSQAITKQYRNFLDELKTKSDSMKTEKKLGKDSDERVGSIADVVQETIDWQEPKSIVSYLDQFVIGQKEAKMVIAVAFSSYMTKVRTKDEELRKDNVLLIGPSGVGKTYMISLLAQKAELPMVQTKLTGKSVEGYVGENFSLTLLQMRSRTTGEAPYGIIFLDEIDKLALETDGHHFFGNRLQDELIGCLEEAVVQGDRKETRPPLNTKNILFVAAGAFSGFDGPSLTKIITERVGGGQAGIGFGAQQQRVIIDETRVLHKVRPEDLIQYGLKTELVGRMPSVTVLDPLSIEDKVEILTSAKRSPLSNYRKHLKLKGYTLTVDESVPELVARLCPPETGARALAAICNDLFTDILFEPDKYSDGNKHIRITDDVAKETIKLYG